jgi:hypothetical protein
MRQPRLPLTSQELTLPWRIIGHIATDGGRDGKDKDQQLFVDAAGQVFGEGTIREDLWSKLAGHSGLSDSHLLLRKSSREDRVLAWESIARQRPDAESARSVHAFVCGYLANVIAPGSFEHWNLILRSGREPHRMLLWYGLFAGLTPGSAVRDAFNGLGRRLLRDITADGSVLDRPRADVALAELEVLSGHHAERASFFTASSNAVNVEIAPCIGTLVRWGGTDLSSPAQDHLFDRSERRADPAVESALLEIRDSLARVEGAHGKLLRSLGLDLEPRRPPRPGGRR